MSAVAYDADLMALLGFAPPETKRPVAAANCNGPQSDQESRNPQTQYTDELSAMIGGSRPHPRQRLIENGYRPIPCTGKRPAVDQWQDLRASADDLAAWPVAARNTGIVLGHSLVAIDVDVRDPCLAAELQDMAMSLGDGPPLVRIGKAPKTLVLYRTGRPLQKRSTPKAWAADIPQDGRAKELSNQVEVLAAGQQFVALGVHPETGRAFRWVPNDRSPLDVPLSGLPMIDLVKLDAYLNQAAQLMAAAGMVAKTGAAPVYQGAPYAAQPDDIDDLLASEPVGSIDDDTDDLSDLVARAWEADPAKLTAALHAVPADIGNDEWQPIMMAWHYESRGCGDARDVFLEWCARDPKFDRRRVLGRWNSLHGRDVPNPTRAGTIYAAAKAYAQPVPEPIPAAASTGLTFLTPDQCEAAPSRGYVIKGLLAPGDIGCIFGQPGAGKSLIGPHLGYALAQGREVFGMRCKEGSVFYVAAEDPHGMKGRVTALKIRHGSADQFALVEGVSDLLSDDSPHLAALRNAVEAQRPSLVFIDTLAMAFPGLEENSPEGMGRVVAAARSLAQWGAAVVLVHHSTKAEGKTPRGHSLFNGALDMAMHVEKGTDGVVRGQLTKNRNGSCDRDMAFLIGTKVLGIDEDGDSITSALVDELAAGSAPRQEKLSPSAQAAFDVLITLQADKGGCIGVHETDWRDACTAGRAVSGAEDQQSRKRAFRRASRELAGQGRTMVVGDMIRPVTFNDSLGLMDEFDDLAA